MNPTSRKRVVLVALCATLVIIGVQKPAHAYVDPGTGAMLLQLLLGGVAGAMVIARLYWQRLREIVSRVFGRATLEKTSPD